MKRHSNPLPTDPASAVALAATKPFGPCWIARSYDDPMSDELARLVTIVVTRKIRGDLLLPVCVLVDRTCLGLKGAVVLRIATRREIDEYLADLTERVGEPLRPCEPLLAQSVVFHAIDYARTLGFVLHRDTPIAMFEPRPATLLDTRLAHPARPLYVQEPEDDVGEILACLESTVGADNYDTVLCDAGFAEEDDVVPDDGVLRVGREPFMPVRLYYELSDAERARAELEALRAAEPDAHLLEGKIAVTSARTLTIDTPTCCDATRAADMVEQWLDARPIRVRVVNRCFAQDEGTPDVLARWLDRNVVVDCLTDDPDDVPLVEDLALDPDDETAIGTLAFGLAMRNLRALRRWAGDTDITLGSMIRMIRVHANTLDSVD